MNKCIVCGKKEVFKDHLCRECFIRQHPVVKSIKPFSIEMCVKCNRAIEKGRALPLEDSIREHLLKAIKLNDDFELKKIDFNTRIDKNIVAIELSVKAVIDGKNVKDNYLIEIPLKKGICKDCNKKDSKAYKGILQVRCRNQEILDKIKKTLFSSKNFINSSFSKEKDGFNIKYLEISEARRMIEGFKKEFYGYSSYSNELFSRDNQTSKDILRTNIRYSPLPFKGGDVILLDNRYYEVKKLKPLMLYDIKKKELKRFDDKRVEQEFSMCKVHSAQLIKLYPEPELLNPNTFKGARVENKEFFHDRDLEVGDYLNAVFINENAYIVSEVKKEKRKEKKEGEQINKKEKNQKKK